MGVKINFETKFGVGGDYVNFDPQISNKTKVNLRMKFWKDKETRDTEETLPFNDLMAGGSKDRIVGFDCNYQFDLDLDSPLNIFQQGYEYLKTLPEFADAEDDLDDDQSAQLGIIQETASTLKTQFNNISKRMS